MQKQNVNAFLAFFYAVPSPHIIFKIVFQIHFNNEMIAFDFEYIFLNSNIFSLLPSRLLAQL